PQASELDHRGAGRRRDGARGAPRHHDRAASRPRGHASAAASWRCRNEESRVNTSLARNDIATVEASGSALILLDALPHPIIMIDGAGHVTDANSAAQDFFQASI